MFDAPWKRPPKCPEDQVSAEDICELLGVPREIAAPPNFQKYVYPCALGVCSDDEVAYRHPGNFADSRLRELFGEQSYSLGTFEPALRALRREAPGPWRKGLAAFETLTAIACVADIVKNRAFSFQVPSAHLVKDTLVFDANQHSYDLPPLSRPRVVVDYGPGLCGRFVVKEHLDALAQGRPFVYLPITKGCFISVFMVSFASTLMTKESLPIYLSNGFFAPREDGMLAASGMLASTAPDTADIVFCSGLQNVDKQELRAGIVNAFIALRAGGILLIRSQRTREPEDSSTVDDMLEIAYDAGFSPKTTRFFHSTSGDPRLGKATPTVSAILTKD